jgi:hypothetical protein
MNPRAYESLRFACLVACFLLAGAGIVSAVRLEFWLAAGLTTLSISLFVWSNFLSHVIEEAKKIA